MTLRKREREKNKEEKRESVFFSGYISLCCPHDLNAWNRLDEDT